MGNGYMGRILWVDLGKGQFDVEELDSLTRADRTLFFKVGYAWVN